jgi:serine/threonine protein phosphatase PrpC
MTPHFGVPGGMCGVPYDHRISVPPGLRLRAVYLDERCGIRPAAQEPAHLSGTPTQDGTYVLRLECTDAKGATVRGEASLVISRDPRSLWRNVPSDPHSPHWKPDHDSVSAECRGWRVQGLSRRGRAHANTGKCREDDMAISVVADRMIAVAVADGAGSAALARLGSRVAVQAAMQALGVVGAQAPTQESLHSQLRSAAVLANQALEISAAAQGVPLSDLSTTLLLLLLVPGPEPLVACLQIGDGVIAACDHERIEPLLVADRGEYASQTAFVSAGRVQAHELVSRIRVQVLPGTRWLLVATDGVTDPFLETDQALHEAQCWAPIDAQLTRATQADVEPARALLCEWLESFTRGHHDDRTLVLLHPCASDAGGQP